MQDAPVELHKEMKKTLQYTFISRLEGVKDSFFVIGPVTELEGDRSTITQYYPDGDDEAYAWPPIGKIKLKQSTVVEPFVTKTTVIVGGRIARLSSDAWERRNASASVRAARQGLSTISRGNQWDISNQSQGKGKSKGKGKGEVKGKSKAKSAYP